MTASLGMNIAKRDYPFWILIGVAVIFVIVLVKNKGDKTDTVVEVSPSPTPGIRVDGVPPAAMSSEASNYMAAITEFEGRRILLAADCQSANPSNITFKNMTQIMIDNRLSDQARIIRMGDRTYTLVARGWYLTTLYSAELPANLQFFCGEMELGQIGLE